MQNLNFFGLRPRSCLEVFAQRQHHRAGRWLLGCLLAWATVAHASMGVMDIEGSPEDGPITVFYPTGAAEQAVTHGPFQLSLAPNAPAPPGQHPLVVISHGSGGGPWVHVDQARALVDAGFFVAVPEHRGDNAKNHSTPGPESWKLRPAEISRAIDAMARHPALARSVMTGRVGVYGGSAGGHTALTLAGGQWSPARFRDHCEAHLAEDFSSCVGFITRLNGGWLDGLKKWVALAVIRFRFGDSTHQAHHDPRVRAVVAAVPFAADFELQTLARPPVAVGLILAGQDINQVPRFHGRAVQAICQTCTTIADLPLASHGVMLSPLPPLGSPDSVTCQLLRDPPGFDRQSLPALHQKVADFFKHHLTQP